jgi:hypothetical protein
MTFTEWRATKRQVLAEDVDPAYQRADDTAECLMYAGGLVIEIRPGGKYLLQLPMEEEVSEELPWLELRLFEFGQEGGLI